ncbi:MAG: class I SAM-dependent methyltransferase [Anaerolineales bacterium]|nr:class I SAM-dependent methyltransferase [Anaerolineales bacterium]
MTDLQRVADRWEQSEWATGIPKDYWSHHPIIDAYINANIIPAATTLPEWLAKNYFPDSPKERAISVCCGTGTCDRQALAAGVCHYLEGFDISSGSIEFAQREAEKAGLGDRVRYWVDDANTIVFEENRYDLAMIFGALHHVDNLEHLCGQLRRTLKPGSYIFINEYIGPPRFQWGAEQVAIINRVMSILPPMWRRAPQVLPPNKEDVIRDDPSEATRSDEIISILCDNFELVDYCDYGGALLMPLWANGIIPDVFMQDKVIDKQVIIKLLVLIDELLAEHNIVPSIYAQLVLRNQPPLPGQEIVPNRLSVNSPDRKRWVDQWLPGPGVKTALAPKRRWPFASGWQILRQHGPRIFVRETIGYFRKKWPK